MEATWREEALAQVRPTPEEDEQVQADARALLEAVEAKLDAEGWEGTPRVEGSLAKGTYLHGHADCDVFVAFPTSVDREEMTRRVHELVDLLDDPVVAYAEHPYAQGTFRSHDAEIVPCYALDDPRELRSAVDRTPFHTEHVKAHLDEEGRDEVRLLKAFLAGIGCYGAEEAVRGVSGYLAECFVLAHGSFEATLSWAVDGFEHPVALEEDPAASFDEDALVVIDPVDPTRNAAAAVSPAVLVRIREAAATFRLSPSTRFFTVPPAPSVDAGEAVKLTDARESRVLTIQVPAGEAELENEVHAQVRRAATLAAEELEREQIPVLAATTVVDADADPWKGWVAIEARGPALEAPYLHGGPPAHVDEHADRFRERWVGDPALVGDVFEEDGRLWVRVAREADTLAAIVEPHLADAKAGKVVDTAIEADALVVREGKEAIAETPAHVLGALLDRRRPWERL